MQLGLIGLGKMGSRMTMKLLFEGHELVVWNRSEAAIEELKFKIQNSKFKTTRLAAKRADQNLKIAKTIEELVKNLEKPRVIWLMVPAGSATQSVLDEVEKWVEKGDIVIDGSNAFYKDTELRYKKLKTKHIRYLGIGVSGGIIAAERGYPLMVGGDVSAYQYITPLLHSLVKPHGGYEYVGPGGAGHFVKMIHNGIEYGMMQAIGEGFGVLDKAPYDFDLVEIAKLWQKGTIVSSFLVDRAKDALEKDPKLSEIDGIIDATGEAQWTVNQAKEEGVPVDVIKKSVEFRDRSKEERAVSDSFAARLVAALRREFGGHSVKKKS